MKKKIYALMMVMAMLAVTLVGCNKTTDTTNTTNTEINTETEESVEDVVAEPTEDPVEEPTTEPEVEEPIVEPSEEPTIDGTLESNEVDAYYSHTLKFPNGLEGFTRKYLIDDNPNWSANRTHYVDVNGSEMNFSWDGPAELGERADSSETTLFLYGNDNDYELRAWSFSLTTEEDYLRNFDKTDIVEWDSDVTNYVVDDYYEFIDGTNTARVIFKITRTLNGEEYIGYACYLDNYTNMVCYQTTYLERASIFDDQRALTVVNSLEYWDYIPEETTIE